MANQKKILIMEDEKYLSEMYRMRFEQDNYQVLIAYDGQAGVTLAIKEKPDLILLDIVMPKKDGYQAIKELRLEPQTRNIPIIMFSNLGQKEEIEKGLSLGATDYLVKADLTPSQVVEKAAQFLMPNN